jgi:ABC-type transport system involved in cytochrome c biogenesis permease subunit
MKSALRHTSRSSSILTLFLFLFSFSGFAKAESPDHILSRIPIQSGGRVKPYDTFARESLQLIYGRAEMPDHGSSEVVFSWTLIPAEWADRQFFQITNHAVKEALGFEVKDTRHYSPNEILKKSDRLQIIFQDLHDKQKAQQKLNPFDQAVQRLESQLSLYQGIVTGTALRLVPPLVDQMKGHADAAWFGVNDWPPEMRTKFEGIAAGFAGSVRNATVEATPETRKDQEAALQKLSTATEDFVTSVRARNNELFPDVAHIDNEILFNHLHPFEWAWIFYMLGLILLVLTWRKGWKSTSYLGWTATLVAFSFHTCGFLFRMYLTGRPPVSNMFETVVWVSWGAVLFGMIFSRIQKSLALVVAANMVAALCMILSDFAPTVLDASIQPLQPVLRSNLWLTVHVLTITSSYAAFFLAFFLGDIGLSYYLRGEKKFAKQIASITDGILLATQTGIVLLASGVILGGVWADYSWGRFWGWDPKETWALIALLGYIAMYHGRLAGWLKVFGMNVSSVIAFSLVIMSWYGVNYVLGAGLHSYGFGGGGLPFVMAFVGAHLLYVAITIVIRRGRLAAAGPGINPGE